MKTVINKKDVIKKVHYRNRNESSLELIKALGLIKKLRTCPTSLNVESNGLKDSKEA